MQNNNVPKKQQQLIDTARELFCRHGVRRVTVEEICHRAHVSKMTFYKYFPNKNTLAEHIVRDMMQEGWEKLNNVEAMPIPFTKKLQHMLTYKLTVMSQMCEDFIEEWIQMPFLVEERQKWLKRVTQFLADAQRRGDIRPDIRPEFILVMAEHLQEFADDERLTSLYPDYGEFTREIWNFFYHGIVTKKEN